MSVVRIREGPYYRGFFKKKCMRILSVHGKLCETEHMTSPKIARHSTISNN